MEWTNKAIKLNDYSNAELCLKDMYGYLMVLIMSQPTGLSISKAVGILGMIQRGSIKANYVRFMSKHILGYYLVGRGNTGMWSWNELRDQTKQLGELQSILFGVVRKIFYGH